MGSGVGAYIRDWQLATPLGEVGPECFASLRRGEASLTTEGGRTLSLFPETSRFKNMDVASIIATLAGEIASRNGISFGAPSALLIISTTKGDIERMKEEEYIMGGIAEEVAIKIGAINTPLVISNACISGVSAAVIAKRYIGSALYNDIVVVGCDKISDFIISGFESFKSTDPEPCKPYDRERAGLNLGEAAAALLISRNGKIRIKGGAITNDANHISGPSRSGDGLYYAIEEAMKEAYGTLFYPISFINAHGTATLYNDEMESKAIALAKMESVPLNSVKGYLGHTLGACGVVELAICAHQLEEGIILPTKGYEAPGTPFQPNITRSELKINGKRSSIPANCIKCASGFGGCNAAVVLEVANGRQESGNDAGALAEYSCRDSHSCTIEDGRIELDGRCIFESDNEFPLFIREAYKKFAEPNMKFYKMDQMCKLGYMAAELLFNASPVTNGRKVAVVLSNSNSSFESDMKHTELIGGEATASPAIFVYTLPNIVAGEICIRHKIKGENTFMLFPEAPEEGIPCTVREYARLLITTGKADKVLHGWCSFHNGNYSGRFAITEKDS